MAKYKNVSPLGALDIPALGRIVEADEVFEVAKDLGQYFADQPANFAPVGRVAAAGSNAKDKPAEGEHKEEGDR